jgi:hypothetical protein
MRWVAAHPANRAQGSDSQSCGLARGVSDATEGDQLAVDMSGKRPRQLEWIPLAAAE